MTDIGFLGLGRMGAAIAGRMVDAGQSVTVWNRSASASAEKLQGGGATVAQTPAEALAQPISFSMLADDTAADAVLSRVNLGDGPAGRIHVNMASLSAGMADLLAQRFAEAGVTYVAAPVLGRPEVAEAGKLNIILAGPAEALDRIDPILEPCSARRWPVGDRPRQANAVKIALNFMLLHALESLSEGIALVEAEDVDAGAFVELLTNSFFGGMVHTIYGNMMAERRYSPPGFTLPLGLKDLGLAEQLAAESKVEIATAPVIRRQLETALADPELAELDWAAVAEVSRRRPNAQ